MLCNNYKSVFWIFGLVAFYILGSVNPVAAEVTEERMVTAEGNITTLQGKMTAAEGNINALTAEQENITAKQENISELVNEINAALNSKANTDSVESALALKADISNTYTKSDVDTALNSKADKSALDDEISRAKAAEQQNANDISTNKNAITNETTRAQAAEQANTSAIATETARAQTAEASLTTLINTETSRAQTAEASLTTLINTETARAQAAELTAETNAKAYANSLAVNYDAAGAANTALANAKSYADGLADNYDAAGAANTALANAISYADELTSAIGTELALKADTTYVDTEIADINEALELKADKSELTALGERMGTAESDIETLQDDLANTTRSLSTHLSNTDVHITTEERTKWNAKQDALTEPQQAAVDSGITSDKVSTYDGYAAEIAKKANTDDVYTKTEVDGKVDAAERSAKSYAEGLNTAMDNRVDDLELTVSGHTNDIADINEALELKADAATTLAGYGITDAYTKTEVDTELAKKANSADVYTKTEIDGKVDAAERSAQSYADGLNTAMDGRVDDLEEDIAQVRSDAEAAWEKGEKWISQELGYDTKTTDAKTKLAEAGFESTDFLGAVKENKADIAAEAERAQAAEQENAQAIAQVRSDAEAAYDHAHNWAEYVMGVDVDENRETQLQTALSTLASEDGVQNIESDNIAGALHELDVEKVNTSDVLGYEDGHALFADPSTASDTKVMSANAVKAVIEDVYGDANEFLTKELGYDTKTTDAKTKLAEAGFESTDFLGAVKENKADIATETARATAAEQANAQAISDETDRATAEEKKLNKKINKETTRAKEAEEVLQSNIDAETERAKAAEQAAEANAKTYAKNKAKEAEINAKKYAKNKANEAEIKAKTYAKNYADGLNDAMDTRVTAAENDVIALYGHMDTAEYNIEANANAIAALDANIGNMNFSNTRYVSDSENITAAINKLDSSLSTVDNEIQHLGHHVDDVEKHLRGGIAATTALTALVPNARDSGDTQISLGSGYYADKVGLAAGMFHYVNDRLLLNAGGSFATSKDWALRAGVTFGL